MHVFLHIEKKIMMMAIIGSLKQHKSYMNWTSIYTLPEFGTIEIKERETNDRPCVSPKSTYL